MSHNRKDKHGNWDEADDRKEDGSSRQSLYLISYESSLFTTVITAQRSKADQ